MSNKSTEHLSSLMDGEVTEETGLFLARRMCADEALGETWGRYHMIRDCLRSSGHSISVSHVRLDMKTASAEIHEPADQGAPRWLRPLSGLAIAASVAVVAVLAVVPQPGDDPMDGTQPFTAPNPLRSAATSDAASFSAGAVQRQQLSDYLEQHQRAAGSMSPQGFVQPAAVQSPGAPDPEADDAAGEAGNDGASPKP